MDICNIYIYIQIYIYIYIYLYIYNIYINIYIYIIYIYILKHTQNIQKIHFYEKQYFVTLYITAKYKVL